MDDNIFEPLECKLLNYITEFNISPNEKTQNKIMKYYRLHVHYCIISKINIDKDLIQHYLRIKKDFIYEQI